MSKGQKSAGDADEDLIRMLKHALEANRELELYRERSPRRSKVKPLLLAVTNSHQHVLCAQLLEPTASGDAGAIVWYHLSGIDDVILTHRQARGGARSLDLEALEFVSVSAWNDDLSSDVIDTISENSHVEVIDDGN